MKSNCNQDINISIIIPVFNAERFVKECIKSLLHQTHRNFEAIFIDDGSNDNSATIIKRYSKTDSRIIYIYQPNAGVSAARNKGLSLIKHELITFIDSDDYVASDYLENLLKPLYSFPYDLITSGIIFFNENGLLYPKRIPNKIWNLNFEEDYIGLRRVPFMTSPVGKVYRRSIIYEYNIRFNRSLSFAEDKEFNIKYTSRINNAVSIDYKGYFYRRGISDSLSVKDHDSHKRFYDTIRQWKLVCDICKERGFVGVLARQHLSNTLFNIINDYISDASNRFSITRIRKVLNESQVGSVNQFLKNNKTLICANGFVKFLILNKLFLLCAGFHKVQSLIRKNKYLWAVSVFLI